MGSGQCARRDLIDGCQQDSGENDRGESDGKGKSGTDGIEEKSHHEGEGALDCAAIPGGVAPHSSSASDSGGEGGGEDDDGCGGFRERAGAWPRLMLEGAGSAAPLDASGSGATYAQRSAGP